MARPPASPIAGFLGERIARGDFPGASYLVADGDRIVEEGALGDAVVTPERIAATPATLYDLASLTKPLATAILAVRLEAAGRLRLDDRLARHLPAWGGGDARAEVTLLDLLAHRSGLPAWKPLYLHARDRHGRIRWLTEVALAHPPRQGVAYSCLGYILLGFALEAIGGAPLDRLLEREVTGPLGLAADLRFRPGAADRRRTAATEEGNERERSLAGPEGEGYNGWRRGVIWGEVHDGNAHTLGGVSGNAGLFGTAGAVGRLAREFLGGGVLLPAGRIEAFRRSETAGLQEERSVGFQVALTPGSSAGTALSPGSFGHTGFTGTSVWIDPDQGRIYVLLTNRVHPRFREIDMNGIRREFHRLAATV